MMTKCFIDRNIDGRLKITTPYLSDFVDDLKNNIPSQYREWVRFAKTWLIDSHYQLDLEAICRKHFDEVHIDTTTQSFGFSAFSKIEESYAILYLTHNAPMWLITKVWKLLAQEYHPDKNKDGAKRMVEINEAYQKIKEKQL